MSTIDAAIIKALVEHIGGDSSTIPDGIIGGDSDIMKLWANKKESAAADIQTGMEGVAYLNITGDPEDALGFHLLKINIFNTDYYGIFINNGTSARVELIDENNNTMSSTASKASDGIYSLDGCPAASVNFDENILLTLSISFALVSQIFKIWQAFLLALFAHSIACNFLFVNNFLSKNNKFLLFDLKIQIKKAFPLR